MMTPDLHFWSQLLVRLAVEAACVVGIAWLLDRMIRPAFWRRALWQSAAVCLLLLTASELSGFGRGLAGYLFGHARPEPKFVLAANPVAAAPMPPPVVASAAARVFTPAPLPLPLPPVVKAVVPGPVWWPGLLWLGGAFVILGRVAVAQMLFISLRRRRPAPARGDLHDRAAAILQRLAVRRKIRVLQSPGLSGPLAFGILRPSVGLPADFAAKFSRAEQDAMLAHELAHLAAHDPLWYLLADAGSAALWWQPLAWWARRRLHRASELAADEAASIFPDGPAALAGCLVTLGKQMTQRPATGWMGVEGGGFRSNLAERVQRLLHLADAARQPSYGWRARAARLGAILAVSAAALGLAGCLQSRDAFKQPTLQANLSQSWNASPASTVWHSALPAKKSEPPASKPITALPAKFDLGVVDAAQPVSPPVPIADAAAGPANAGNGRDAIVRKLRGIKLREVAPAFEQGLPLSEVLKILTQFSITNAADHTGVNFLFNPRVGGNPAGEGVDPGTITIRITPPLKNVTLLQLMDAIRHTSDQPIDFSVSEYAVWFYVKPPPNAALGSRLQPFAMPVPGTTKEYQAVIGRLQDLRMKEQPSVLDQGLPLTEVLKILNKFSITNDLGHIGVNFLFNPRVGANAAGEQVDPGTITVRITPPLKNVTVLQLLDAICQMADQPIEFSVTDYAVWFFVRPPPNAAPETKASPVPDPGPTTNPANPTPPVAPNNAPSATAPIPVQTPTNGAANPEDTQLVTEIVPVHRLDPSQVVKALSTLIPQGAQMAIGGSNAVVMTVRRSDVRRFAQIISAIDSAGEGDLQVFSLRSADSKDVASELMGVLSPQVGGNRTLPRASADASPRPAPVRINAVSDDPNNAVVVRAPEDLMNPISNMIQQLDIPQKDVIQIRRFVLRDADSTAVAQKVNVVFSDANLQANQNQNGIQGAALTKPVIIKAVPDPRTQSVLITAPKDSMPEIEKIVNQMENDAKSANSSPRVLTRGQMIARELRGTQTNELLNKLVPEMPLVEVLRLAKQLSISNETDNIHSLIQLDVKVAIAPTGFLSGPVFNVDSKDITSISPPRTHGDAAPSFQTPTSTTNPSAIFPAVYDGTNRTNAFVFRSLILDAAESRLLLTTIERQTNANILACPRTTTESGRQEHVAVGDIVGDWLKRTPASAISREVPAVDILPTVSQDGSSIQIAAIPSVTEFFGYDKPGQFIPESRDGNDPRPFPPVQLPLPTYRVRQTVIETNLLDGQTLVLRALPAENATNKTEQLLIFITPTIVDPAGHPVHTDAEMPAFPPQPPTTGQSK